MGGHGNWMWLWAVCFYAAWMPQPIPKWYLFGHGKRQKSVIENHGKSWNLVLIWFWVISALCEPTCCDANKGHMTRSKVMWGQLWDKISNGWLSLVLLLNEIMKLFSGWSVFCLFNPKQNFSDSWKWQGPSWISHKISFIRQCQEYHNIFFFLLKVHYPFCSYWYFKSCSSCTCPSRLIAESTCSRKESRSTWPTSKRPSSRQSGRGRST